MSVTEHQLRLRIFEMLPLIKTLLTRTLPFSNERANCFNAVQLYFGDSQLPKFTGPEEFISYMQKYFVQNFDPHVAPSISIIWSCETSAIRKHPVQVSDLVKINPGYPFGLIIEHAFVHLDSTRVFQKRDPTNTGPYEIVTEKEAINPYETKNGFEITRHLRSNPS